MSEKHDIRRLMGLDSTRPTLSEARVDVRVIDETEQLFATIRDAVAEDQMREMKLGIAGRMGGASDEPAPPKPAKAPASGVQPVAPASGVRVTASKLQKKPAVAKVESLDPHHMNAHELAAYTGSAHNQHHAHGEEHDAYFHASGKAHHVSQQAHEFSAMMKSGELPKDKPHHAKAHDLHMQGYTNHRIAGSMADKLGHSAQRNAHFAEGGKHQDHMAKHGRHIGK